MNIYNFKFQYSSVPIKKGNDIPITSLEVKFHTIGLRYFLVIGNV